MTLSDRFKFEIACGLLRDAFPEKIEEARQKILERLSEGRSVKDLRECRYAQAAAFFMVEALSDGC